MANSSDMNVALRFQADVSQARAELKSLRADAEAVGQGTQKIDTAPIDKLAGSAKQAGTASKGMGAAAKTASAETKAQADASAAATAAVQAQAKAVNGAAKANQAAGISAKQLAAANRMLPAQITDTVVGLGSGQSLFTVALQQGGQVKDMYGGIVPAAKAVSSAVMGMVNPYTLAASAVVAMGAAWYSAAKESEGYTKAIVLTGNAAGTTVSQLSSVTRAIGEMTGSYGLANQAVTSLAATGRVTSSVIAIAAQSTVAMARATGESVDEMVQKFAELGKAPVEASKKLNEQYNYLTLTIYQQIKALEEQDRKEEAAALAQRSYAQAMNQRANEVQQSLNALGKAFQWVGDKASGMWQAIKDSVRTAPLAAQFADAQKEYLYLTKMSTQGSKIANFFGIEGYDSTKDDRLAAYKKMMDLQRQMDAETKRAADQQKRAQDTAAGITAVDAVTAANKAALSPQQKLTAALKEYHDQIEVIRKIDPGSKLLDPATIAQTEAALRKKFLPKTGAGPKTNPVDTAYQSKLQSLEQARAQAEQGLENAQDKVSSKTDQATAALESWLSVNKNALKLDDARIAKLREVAAETDRLNKSTKDLQDSKARDERITHGLAQVDEAISQAQGRTAEATAARMEERFRKLRDDLTKTGNMDGLVKVDKLVAIESAKAQLETLQQQADRIFSDQSRTEQSLANQVTAGLTGELEAKRQILDINTSTAAQIEALLPKMRELAEITGNASAIDRVKDLELRIQGLRTKANEVSQAFGNAFGNSLSNSLKSLADGTASLGEAVRGLLSNLAQGMGEWAAQQLAMRAQEGVMGLINGAGTAATGAGAAEAIGATATSTAITAASAAGAASMGAGISSGGSLAALEMSTAITTAGAAAAQAIAAAMAAAMAAASAGQASSGIASAVGAAAGSFSSGGWTGPGTKYQYAGVVHADEFVHRQEVVRQPGALAFLTRFNQVGMAALNDWLPYADGGLVVGGNVSLGLPSVGNFKPAAPAAGNTTLDNQQNFYLVDDPERIASMIGSKQGEKAIAVMISRNPGKFRQLMGVS